MCGISVIFPWHEMQKVQEENSFQRQPVSLASGVSSVESCDCASRLRRGRCHPPLHTQAPSLPSMQRGPPGPRLPAPPTPGHTGTRPRTQQFCSTCSWGEGPAPACCRRKWGAPSPRYLRVKAEMQALPHRSAPSSGVSHPPSQPNCCFFRETDVGAHGQRVDNWGRLCTRRRSRRFPRIFSCNAVPALCSKHF